MAPHKARRGRIRKCSSSFISSARRSLDTPPGLGRFASPPHVEALPPPPPAPRSGLFRCPWSVMTIMQACLLAKRFARHHAQRPQRSTAARGIWGWGGTGAAPLRRFSGRCAPVPTGQLRAGFCSWHRMFEELQKRSNQGKEERREKERRGGGRERALGSVGGAMFHSIRAAQGTSQLAWLAGGKGFVYTESQPTGAGVCACRRLCRITTADPRDAPPPRGLCVLALTVSCSFAALRPARPLASPLLPLPQEPARPCQGRRSWYAR